MTLAGYSFITTAPTNFAGAATVHARMLQVVAGAGADVFLISAGQPHLRTELWDAGVRTIVKNFVCDAYPNSDWIASLAVRGEIVDRAYACKRTRVVLMGTYLFPYYGTIVDASRVLRRGGLPHITIGIPAGSDIWQLGPQFPSEVSHLLDEVRTDLCLAYSRTFAHEVKAYADRQIHVVMPPIDTDYFSPYKYSKSDLRERLGIPVRGTVLLVCCNMRPIKRLDRIAWLFAEHLTQAIPDLHLVLVGPVTGHLQQSFAQYVPTPLFPGLKVEMARGGSITVVGLQRHVRSYHQAADIALNLSGHDSFNVSLAESMACGTPVITPTHTGVSELIEYGGGGLLIDTHAYEWKGLRFAESPALPDRSIKVIVEYMSEKARFDGDREIARRAVQKACHVERIRERFHAILRSV